MATALETIEAALKLLGVKTRFAPIEAEEAQDGLKALNNMLNGWEEKFIHLGFVSMTDVDDELFVPESVQGGVESNLAIYMAPEYNREPTNTLARRARKDYKDIRAAYVRVRPTQFPDTLPVGSGNPIWNSGHNGDIPNDDLDNHFYPDNLKRNF